MENTKNKSREYKEYCVQMAQICEKKAQYAADSRIKDFWLSAKQGFLKRV